MASAVRSYGEKAFTQELRLISKTEGAFDYVLGAYYQDQDRFATQVSYLRGFKRWWDAAFPGIEGAVISDVDFDYRQDENFRETAVYGELTWHTTDSLQFTGGFRHFRHEAETDVAQTPRTWAPLVDSSQSHGAASDTPTLFTGNVYTFLSPRTPLYAHISARPLPSVTTTPPTP